MQTLMEIMEKHPIVPFIRESDLAVRRPWNSPERRLLDYLMVYVQKGQCAFTVNGERQLFNPGEFCLIQPGSLTELEGLTDTETPFAHLDIFYKPGREKSFPTRPGQIDLTPYQELMQPSLNELYDIEIPVRLRFRNPNKMAEMMLRMISLWQQRDPLSQIKAQHTATEIFIAILDNHAQLHRPGREHTQDLSWMHSYLSFHLGETLSIGDMARRASLSPSRFSAVFKEQFGMAPHQYLLNMRVEHAKELLEVTTLSQEEIASYCGFANIHHFSKVFRKRTGRSPGGWRQKH
ncbi:helix-turn-helix domain-containing protein [Paenibacillus guangzhouensis]|uniref:helix-turn-helix domain-containing protein n=1 Tax=Paenibacillus guangzhouensis TaxID=1473112 RepID=UPI001D1181CE|nr:helix-turn-helix domain-containing protein [Paenibacillus guangzhouensis]